MTYFAHRSPMLRIGVVGPWRSDLARSRDRIEAVPSPSAITRYDQLLVTFDDSVPPDWAQALARGVVALKSVRHVDEYLEVEHGRVVAARFDPGEVLVRERAGYGRAKRALDWAVLILLAPLAIVIFTLTWIAIDLNMGSPVLFRQTRVGRDGAEFAMLKFRTMRPDVPGGRLTAADDPRVTPLGRFLRRARIDELPQLWHVASGEMSLVGPRPEQPALAAEYTLADPAFALRLLAAPGITGWAQVRGGYASNLSESEIKLGCDLYYLKHRSLGLDLQILLRTVWTVVSGAGAR